MPKFTVIQSTEYEISANTAEEARDRWLSSEWDWKLEAEAETCHILDWKGNVVWEP